MNLHHGSRTTTPALMLDHSWKTLLAAFTLWAGIAQAANDTHIAPPDDVVPPYRALDVRLDAAAPEHVDLQSRVPAWMQGEWRRDWIERDGARSNTRAVIYLQAPSHFGDLRIPLDRPSPTSAKSFADLDDAALRALLKQQGMVGLARWDGAVATWTAEIAFQPSDGSVDSGRIERRGGRAFLEHALDDSYVESWTKRASARERRFLVVRVEREHRLDRMLVVVGDRFVFARNRTKDLPSAESLEALAEAEHADRARLVDYLDCEISSGSVRRGDARWIVERSTLPWREGTTLPIIDELRNANLRPGSGFRTGPGEHWSVPVNTFPDRELRKSMALREQTNSVNRPRGNRG